MELILVIDLSEGLFVITEIVQNGAQVAPAAVIFRSEPQFFCMGDVFAGLVKRCLLMTAGKMHQSQVAQIMGDQLFGTCFLV